MSVTTDIRQMLLAGTRTSALAGDRVSVKELEQEYDGNGKLLPAVVITQVPAPRLVDVTSWGTPQVNVKAYGPDQLGADALAEAVYLDIEGKGYGEVASVWLVAEPAQLTDNEPGWDYCLSVYEVQQVRND